MPASQQTELFSAQEAVLQQQTENVQIAGCQYHPALSSSLRIVSGSLCLHTDGWNYPQYKMLVKLLEETVVLGIARLWLALHVPAGEFDNESPFSFGEQSIDRSGGQCTLGTVERSLIFEQIVG